MTIDAWKTIYDRFNPTDPVPLDKPEWRIDRKYSPARKIASKLNTGFGRQRYLIVGTTGSGKSTELHQIAEKRTERDFVVVIDLKRHFDSIVKDGDALNHVQAWEVILLIGLHLYHAAEEKGHSWSKDAKTVFRSAMKQLYGDDEAQLDLAKLASTTAVVVGGVLSRTPGAITTGIVTQGLGRIAEKVGTWNLSLGRRPHAHDQDQPVQSILGAVNLMITELERQRSVSLFVDGLDFITDTNTIKRLFVSSSLFGKLVCTTIMCGPILILQEGYAAGVDMFQVMVLANIPILDPNNPADPTEDGASFFYKVWDARTPNAEMIPRDLLGGLALASGGRLREFVRMIGLVAEESAGKGETVASKATVLAMVNERRLTHEMGFDQGVRELLEAVMVNKNYELPDHERTESLLKNFWLLPYPNSSVWYYPHPLLLMSKLKSKLNGSPPLSGL